MHGSAYVSSPGHTNRRREDEWSAQAEGLGERGVTAEGCRASFWGDENVPNGLQVPVARL